MITSVNYNQVTVLPLHIQEQLIKNSNAKYQSIFLLMLDCGLRVTETISLQVKNFNFFEQEVIVKSLKKRDKQTYRSVPMTTRVLEALGNYWKVLKNKTPDAYVFPPGKKSKKKHLNRIQVWRQIKRKTNGYAYPHMCRHTFATRIVNEGNDIRVAQKLLGHASIKTTEIYTHVDSAQMKAAIKSIERTPWYMEWYRKFFPAKQIILTPTQAGMTKFHVGRTTEMSKLADLMHKKVNIYLQADMGLGKSHLLDSIEGEKILRLDEFAGKKALAALLIEIFERDKPGIAELLFGINLEEGAEMPDTKDLVKSALSRDRGDLTKVVMKESIKRLVELLIQVTSPQEYTIIIDDATDITKSGVKNLEKLKNHFHLVVAARNIKIDKGTFLTNFEKIELQPLERAEATELINLAAKSIYTRIEDYETFKNHIWESTGGNPLYMLEMIDRYSKEMNISLEVTKDIQHTAAHQEINMALPVIILISGLMVLRYYGREAGDDSGAFMLIGGIFMIFALFARPLANLGKRKWI